MPKHDFKIVPYSKDLTFKDIELDNIDSMDDRFILYILDSLQWVPSHWNDLQNKKAGLNYYGVTFFCGKEISLLRSILSSWFSLFENAPGEFKLERSIYPDEVYQKEIILSELENVMCLCDKALKNEEVLVHYGI